MSSRVERFGLVGSLYVSQAIPLGFIFVALPAILARRGVPEEQIGLLGALSLPWLIKFLWAPAVDRFGSARGHYRSWLIPLQLLSVATVAALALFNLDDGLGPLLGCIAAFMFFSATQDIATDGLAVRNLRPEERGLGNGIQVGGYYLGQILGGAAILLVFARAGWAAAVLTMSLLLALPLVQVLRFREPAYEKQAGERVSMGALVAFMRRPGNGSWILVLLLYRAGESTALLMVNTLLIDRGFSLEQVAVTLGAAGSVASLIGALVAGAAIGRLGRRAALLTFGTLQALALLAYRFLDVPAPEWGVVLGAVILVAFCSSMATGALYTHMMDRSEASTASTDFTLQQSFAALGPAIGAGFSGFSVAAFGYATHFTICAGVAALAVLLVALRIRPRPVSAA
ncbi:hypothetical protein ABI59_14395 [Acidobacteria bacterium Mor1]|nr:hypothetical protein ABI59_14395 [Acidobacteria bacterium Mor1]